MFEEVANALGGLVPRQLGKPRCQARSNGIKVWFGTDRPPWEHYEAQVIGPQHDAGAVSLALEVGFHSEYPHAADNDAVIAHLLGCQDGWRPALGDEAVVGPFLGHPQAWRRVSETWPDVDLMSTDLAFEVAARLADYVTALEPLRPGGIAATG